MELSRDLIAEIIANNVTPSEATMRAARCVTSIDGVGAAADAIWQIIAAHIEESENRIIDAEFALQDLKSKTEVEPKAQ